MGFFEIDPWIVNETPAQPPPPGFGHCAGTCVILAV